MADIKLKANTIATLMSTELNSLANNGGALGAEFDNSTGLWIKATFLLTVTFGTNPTAGYTCDLYLIPALDGTNYADNTTGASGYAPGSAYVGGFPLQAKTTIHRVPLGVGQQGAIELPPSKFKAFLLNKSGVAFPASGSTVTMLASMYQSV